MVRALCLHAASLGSNPVLTSGLDLFSGLPASTRLPCGVLNHASFKLLKVGCLWTSLKAKCTSTINKALHIHFAHLQCCFAKWAQKLACKQHCDGRVSLYKESTPFLDFFKNFFFPSRSGCACVRSLCLIEGNSSGIQTRYLFLQRQSRCTEDYVID